MRFDVAPLDLEQRSAGRDLLAYADMNLLDDPGHRRADLDVTAARLHHSRAGDIGFEWGRRRLGQRLRRIRDTARRRRHHNCEGKSGDRSDRHDKA
ncbi:hypothetical protein [Methylosinus sp. H3A]|uniref:hypothetical protein n=1 Tax=Methylosinus sp. H3A TaxID=2785786 RepID=UPI002896B46A|nr:hypothetical protein [Methylosinus sp. H3A]